MEILFSEVKIWMLKNTEKHVQCQLGVDTYLKLREYATLHSLSLSNALRYAVENFINKEKIKDVSKEIIQS